MLGEVFVAPIFLTEYKELSTYIFSVSIKFTSWVSACCLPLPFAPGDVRLLHGLQAATPIPRTRSSAL